MGPPNPMLHLWSAARTTKNRSFPPTGGAILDGPNVGGDRSDDANTTRRVPRIAKPTRPNTDQRGPMKFDIGKDDTVSSIERSRMMVEQEDDGFFRPEGTIQPIPDSNEAHLSAPALLSHVSCFSPERERICAPPPGICGSPDVCLPDIMGGLP